MGSRLRGMGTGWEGSDGGVFFLGGVAHHCNLNTVSSGVGISRRLGGGLGGRFCAGFCSGFCIWFGSWFGGWFGGGLVGGFSCHRIACG